MKQSGKVFTDLKFHVMYVFGVWRLWMNDFAFRSPPKFQQKASWCCDTSNNLRLQEFQTSASLEGMRASKPVCQDAFYPPCHTETLRLCTTAHCPWELIEIQFGICLPQQIQGTRSRKNRCLQRTHLQSWADGPLKAEVHLSDFAWNIHKWCMVNLQMYDKQHGNEMNFNWDTTQQWNCQTIIFPHKSSYFRK